MRSMGKWMRRAATAAAVVLLASCGGGTEQITPFEPTRYIVFGDAASVLTKDEPQGRKYTVNAVSSTGGPTCNIGNSTQFALLWTQVLANTFNLVFEECNPNGRPVNAFIYAQPEAKSTDFAAQVAEARARHGDFGCNDLLSVMIGVNDVIELFETQYLPNPTSANATAITNELIARGRRLGQSITALTGRNGSNIIVSTIPLMNQTPYGLKKAAENPGKNVLNVLNNFSAQFNTSLRTSIPNNGAYWGLVELDAFVNAVVGDPSRFDVTNWTEAVCKADLPNCSNTEEDLVPDGNAATWLWANDRWIGWKGHANLGSFARDRAEGNPFGCE